MQEKQLQLPGTADRVRDDWQDKYRLVYIGLSSIRERDCAASCKLTQGDDPQPLFDRQSFITLFLKHVYTAIIVAFHSFIHPQSFIYIHYIIEDIGASN